MQIYMHPRKSSQLSDNVRHSLQLISNVDEFKQIRPYTGTVYNSTGDVTFSGGYLTYQRAAVGAGKIFKYTGRGVYRGAVGYVAQPWMANETDPNAMISFRVKRNSAKYSLFVGPIISVKRKNLKELHCREDLHFLFPIFRYRSPLSDHLLGDHDSYAVTTEAEKMMESMWEALQSSEDQAQAHLKLGLLYEKYHHSAPMRLPGAVIVNDDGSLVPAYQVLDLANNDRIEEAYELIN